ncbi:MAG: hypothetical protein JW959_07255, partial [Pirellulales bacterium]|nr:hypothetical protein [Pirellulales bacterium]
SGLMEITYKSGARVILEGPCTYKVESSAGGFLAIGKLTANIRTQSSKPKAQSSEPSPLSSLPSPLFAVRTPTAIVTDLGTEFGVEVAKNGDTTSHVFKGSVQVQILPSPASGRRAGGEGGMVQLDTGESVLVKKGEDGPVVVRSGVGDGAARFTRRMPKTGAAKILISQNFDSHPFYDGFTFSTDSSRYSRTIGGAWRLHYLIGDSGASVANEFSYSGGHSVHVERLAGSTPRLSASTERLGAPIGAGRLVSSVRLRRGEYGGLVHGVGQNVEVESGHLAVDVASPAVVIQTDGTIKARRYDAAAKTWDYTDPLKDAGENLVAVPPRVWFGVKMEIDLDSLTYDVWYDAGSGYVLAASKLPTDGAPIDCMGFCIQGEQGGERRSEIWIDDVVLELDESGK